MMKILFWQITTCLCHVLHATPKFLTLSIDSDEGRILKLVGGKSSLAHLTTQPWLKDLCDFPPVPAAAYSQPEKQTALAGFPPTQSRF